MIRSDIKKSFLEGKKLLVDFIDNEANFALIEAICEDLAEGFRSGNKILICGNGGSLADSVHFAEELTGRFRKNRPALSALALAEPSFITCAANDFGYQEIFSRGVEAYGNQNDTFIGLSTSGNSENIIRAVKTAKEKKLRTILLLGKDGGGLKGQADYEFIIKGKTSDRIQEIHMFILHTLVEGIERILFPENYQD